MTKATQRLYSTADGRLVYEGDPAAVRLVAAAGDDIPDGYSAPDDAAEPEPEAEPKAAAKPANKAVKKSANK